MVFIIYGALILFAAGIHILIDRSLWGEGIAETFLLYLLAIGVGLSGLVGFLGHAFRANRVAEYIGWPAGNPFQFEVAVANLAVGVLGILCIWIRGDFWVATGIGASVFYLGAAYGHIREIVVNANRAPGNAGPVVYYDLLLPVAIVGSLIGYKMTA